MVTWGSPQVGGSAVDRGHDPEFYNSERQKINPVESFIQLIAEEP
jgi:hypothetical protein